MNVKLETGEIIFSISVEDGKKKLRFTDEKESVNFVVNDETRFVKKEENDIVFIENGLECQILFGKNEVTVSVNYVPVVYGGGDFTRVKELLKLL